MPTKKGYATKESQHGSPRQMIAGLNEQIKGTKKKLAALGADSSKAVFYKDEIKELEKHKAHVKKHYGLK